MSILIFPTTILRQQPFMSESAVTSGKPVVDVGLPERLTDISNCSTTTMKKDAMSQNERTHNIKGSLSRLSPSILTVWAPVCGPPARGGLEDSIA